MSAPQQRSRVGFVVVLPLLVFLALAALFYTRLGAGDTSRIPSALIGKTVPATSLPALDGVGLPGLSEADLKTGAVTLVNIFASWCGPCREEHPHLMDLSRNEALKAKGVRIAGLAYKDEPENSRRFLGALGNPYAMIGVDRSGRAGIEWGVYGVPETFIVRGDGTIAFKFVGPISEQTLKDTILPQIDRALAK